MRTTVLPTLARHPHRRARHARGVAWLGLTLAVGLVTGSVHAEGLKDRLKGDVKQGLDKEKKKAADKPKPKEDKPKDDKPKPKPKDDKPKPSPKPNPKPKPADDPNAVTLLSVNSKDGEAQPAKPEGPKLPQRVIGKNLRLDLKLGMGYRGWYPQQYDNVSVDVANYYTWQIELKAKLFNKVSLKRGFYESNGLAGPRTKGAAVAAEVGSYAPKAAWLLGVLGFPFLKVWEPTIRYETRAYETRAQPSAPVCIIPRDADENLDLDSCVPTTAPLIMTSGFETLSFGVTYHADKNPSPELHTPKGKVPPLFFGVGLLRYTKPYQLTIGDQTTNDLLFDGRFRGAGLALGTELGGGVDRFYADIDMQTGLGEVSLLESLTLNELAPEDWLIGYIQGRVGFGYNWAFFKGAPTLLLTPWATIGGAWFFFFETQVDEGEEVVTPPVNWDLLWSVGANFTLPL